jgi:hypothetical protein
MHSQPFSFSLAPIFHFTLRPSGPRQTLTPLSALLSLIAYSTLERETSALQLLAHLPLFLEQLAPDPLRPPRQDPHHHLLIQRERLLAPQAQDAAAPAPRLGDLQEEKGRGQPSPFILIPTPPSCLSSFPSTLSFSITPKLPPLIPPPSLSPSSHTPPLSLCFLPLTSSIRGPTSRDMGLSRLLTLESSESMTPCF